jgi:hypothetical protein
MFGVLIGTFTTGYVLAGPFESYDAADEFCHRAVADQRMTHIFEHISPKDFHHVDRQLALSLDPPAPQAATPSSTLGEAVEEMKRCANECGEQVHANTYWHCIGIVERAQEALATHPEQPAPLSDYARAVEALADKWDRIADQHGVRTFTGNDHRLFANELRAALATRPTAALSAPLGAGKDA